MCYLCNLNKDFFKFNNALPNDIIIHNFKDSTSLHTSFLLPPKDALKYLKDKTGSLITTEKWNEINAESHDKAFTVAKVMSADLLQLIYDKVIKAKAEGITLKQFQKELVPDLQNAGWTGVTAGRLRVIYETNMQVSYSKEKYKGMMLVSDKFPYWKYKQIEKKNKREKHSQWHNKVFRYDDPIWQSIYPPSEFGCKCSVVAMTEADVQSQGLTVSNGSDFDIQKPSIECLKAWVPDTKDYVSGIQSQLDKMINPSIKKEVVRVKSTINDLKSKEPEKIENTPNEIQVMQDKIKVLEEKVMNLKNPNLVNNELGNRINRIWHLLPAFFNKKDMKSIEKAVNKATNFDELSPMLKDAVKKLETLI